MNCENLIEQIKYEVESFSISSGHEPRFIFMGRNSIEELKKVFKQDSLTSMHSCGVTLKVIQNNELRYPYVC